MKNIEIIWTIQTSILDINTHDTYMQRIHSSQYKQLQQKARSVPGNYNITTH